MDTQIVKTNGTGASIARQDFDGQEIAPVVETASTATAALVEAKVKARAIIALQRPRDMTRVRERLLIDCRRPGFARAARFSVPRGGKKIEGFSIRFAEAAARALGNLDVSADVIYDDGRKRAFRLEVTDLEVNHTESICVVIEKAIERREYKDGQTVLGSRQNSEGKMVYLIIPSEDELLQRQGALLSKARRNLILSHLPADIKEECERQVLATQKDADAKDPDNARKAIIDAFAKYGVTADHLRSYLGHPADTMSPDEMAELRGVGEAIRDKEITWAAALAEKIEARGETPTPPAAGEQQPKPAEGGKVAAAKAALRKKEKPAEEPALEKPATPQPEVIDIKAAVDAAEKRAPTPEGPDPAVVHYWEGQVAGALNIGKLDALEKRAREEVVGEPNKLAVSALIMERRKALEPDAAG